MSATSLKPVIEKLESLFSSFNQKFYNGELQTPVITVSPDTTKGAYGWCTSWKAWSNLDPDSKTTDISQMSKADLDAMQNEGFYEINICAEHLARPFEQVAETLLHEMVHLYRTQAGTVHITTRSSRKRLNSTVWTLAKTLNMDGRLPRWMRTQGLSWTACRIRSLNFTESTCRKFPVCQKPNSPAENMFVRCAA